VQKDKCAAEFMKLQQCYTVSLRHRSALRLQLIHNARPPIEDGEMSTMTEERHAVDEKIEETMLRLHTAAILED
jgi:hypothetical protein